MKPTRSSFIGSGDVRPLLAAVAVASTMGLIPFAVAVFWSAATAVLDVHRSLRGAAGESDTTVGERFIRSDS